MSIRQNIFKFLRSEVNNQFLVSPLIHLYAVASIIGKEWIGEVTLEDKIKVSSLCNIDTIYHPRIDISENFDEKHPLDWKHKMTFQNDNHRIYKCVLNTPLGNLTRTIKEIKRKSFMQTDSPLLKRKVTMIN